MTRGAEHGGDISRDRKIKKRGSEGMMREIDDAINRRLGYVGKVLVNYIGLAALGKSIDTADALRTAISRLAECEDFSAHMSADSVYQYFHFKLPFR